MTLKEEHIVALVLVQLDDLTRRVEHQGMDLGMLLDGLMSLIERHEREASATAAPLAGGERKEEMWTQLARDHETMLRFEGPLLLARQFQDRLRQRLEHVRAALSALPAAAALDKELGAPVERLFPFEEERAVNAAAFDLEYTPAEEPDVEMFQADPPTAERRRAARS